VGSRLDDLLALLDLEGIEQNLFRGVSPRDGRDRIFGGQVLAQGLVAAGRTVELASGRSTHSLHAYFLRPGDPRIPILFEVDRIRDGRSFTTRRVVAIQRGQAIFNMAVSYQVDEEGLEHQIDAPELPGPEGDLYEEELRRMIAASGREIERDDRRFELPIEIRTLGGLGLFSAEVRPPYTHCWIRAKGNLPDDLLLQQCVLAYASDFTMLVNTLHPHPIAMASARIQTASLDHAMWFHRPFRADEWLLYTQESPVSARARGLARGLVYTREGRLVASCVQEGLLRLRAERPVGPPPG
jgi:acyl-CoA thioesterase-2